VESELYLDGATDVVLRLNDLMVNCIQGPADLTVSVRSKHDSDWSAVPYVYAYFEKLNDADALDKILNTRGLIVWFVAHFHDVYRLFCDPSDANKKAEFLRFQELTHKDWLHSKLEKLKSLSPSEWRSIGPGGSRR